MRSSLDRLPAQGTDCLRAPLHPVFQALLMKNMHLMTLELEDVVFFFEGFPTDGTFLSLLED